MNQLKIGLLINPLAGLGGSVGLKGSDGVADQAISMGAVPKAQERVAVALEMLLKHNAFLSFVTAPGLMGESLLSSMGFQSVSVIALEDKDYSHIGATDASDTSLSVRQFLDHSVDLILFAGGDGTARDICSVVGESIPVLGIPAGVKIHSAVYAVNPQSAGALLLQMIEGELIGVRSADVRDIDEEAFRDGRVQARLYGEMLVPEEGRFVQMMKCGGIEKEEWVITDIAAEIVETMEDDVLYIIGSGATTKAILDELGLEGTLLGVDLVRNRELVANDVSEAQLVEYIDQADQAKLVISVIGGQGHVFGRGNQQLSPQVIRKLGKDHIQIIATKTKIKSLEGRPMLTDTGDMALDRELCGWYRITTGYQDEIVYPVSDGVTSYSVCP
ncbi:ATP-NAD kinase family protein [Litoribrevibacter albus]|uniref:ATP-NAD kinase n=1 Tax=Litoribrevibacter albus TaxID=1473156 RepID=A0AA37W6L9_9GAMM|nr:ATP-NAD kinase family protein [Litoribrevibacter albus]GLQ30104.1 ATP-NAD kinase [Litoribrevibacter albus]